MANYIDLSLHLDEFYTCCILYLYPMLTLTNCFISIKHAKPMAAGDGSQTTPVQTMYVVLFDTNYACMCSCIRFIVN